MEHVRETDLIRLVAGELAPPAAAEVRAHLEACEACRRRLEEQRALWSELGTWEVAGQAPSLGPAVECRLSRPVSARPVVWFIIRASRVAAAVLLGAGVGHGLGRLHPSKAATPQPAPPAEPPAAVSEQLGVELLASPSPLGLYAALLDVDAAVESGEVGS